MNSCLLCHPEEAARTFGRRVVWEDPHWRLAVIEVGSPIAGFAHLETKRHIPDITHLDGGEAATLGSVLSRVTAKLKAVTGADLIYIYVFGERVPHLHFNLAPHHQGAILSLVARVCFAKRPSLSLPRCFAKSVGASRRHYGLVRGPSGPAQTA